MRWSNWTGDQTCNPVAIESPASIDEVSAAVERAAERDWTVRVAGAGHSFSDVATTDGMLLSLERMNRVLEIDRATGLVRVEAGISIRDLNDALDRAGLALPNLGDIDVQSLAGATATGTHGTGARLQNMSAAIHSLELVLADGSWLEVDRESDGDVMRAARVSLGALGVITTMTLDTVPAFTLRALDEARPLWETLERLDELVDSNDHFEFYNFPYSPLALTRTNNRTNQQPQPRSRTRTWVDDELLVNHAFGLVCRVGRRRPPLIPNLNRLASRLAGSSRRIDRSHRVFTSPRRVPFTEMEYAVPRANAVPAVRALLDAVERGGFHVPFPFEVRFVAADDAFLSPAQGRDTCYIAVHMFEGMPWEAYFRAVEAIMVEFDGRPHWGKRHFQSAETLRSRYEGWDRFAAVRSRLDPQRRFTNDYVRRVLGE